MAVALLALLCGRAAAQETPPGPGDDEPGADQPGADQPGAPASSPAPPRPEDIERPRLVRDAQPRYPAAAWDAKIEGDVVLLLTVDATGQVTEVAVDTPAGHGFDEAAVRAARDLRFTPARVAGTPVPIQIRYTFRFRIPEKETVAARPIEACTGQCPVDERAPVKLRATVYERGRGKVLPGVEVYVLDRDEVLLTDASGQFTLEGPPGAYAIVIRPPDYYPFETTERLEPGREVEVKYFVRRHRRARYTTIVWGSEGRAEVARTSLMDDEIRTIPGTLGDPIRVAMLLPGVTSPASGIGYPIVRGALPGDSLYEIDGIQVPMLYHLFFGNAVIHPRFVDEITFQPGGYGAAHGRFPGGRIAATSAKVDADPLWAAHLSIIETSLLRAQPVGTSSEFMAAARYGTLGYIIEGLAANTVFRYWDYQTRLAHRFGDGGKLSLTVLGAQDTAGEFDRETGEENVLRLGFHTADLRYRRGLGNDAWLVAGVQGGYELFVPPDEDGEDDPAVSNGDARMWKLRPYVQGGIAPMRGLEVEAGADVLYQDFGLKLAGPDNPDFRDTDTGITLGAWLTGEWQRGPVVVSPGLRVDHYRYHAPDRTDQATAVEPRLAASYAWTDALTTKASIGLHAGPPRFSFVEPPLVFGPIPAYEGFGLNFGLTRAWQAQAGVESRLPGGFELGVTGFHHDLYQAIDFSLLDKQLVPDPIPCNGSDDELDLPLPLDIEGRSYGAELMLRRRLGEAVFGWVSYSLSRSERSVPRLGTLPFDFDQTHVLNTVVSWDVGRNWTLGAVLHVNTGRPYTPLVVDRCASEGFEYYEGRRGAANAARFPTYWRIDARIQKREVFETWFFDFYVDLFNASFQWETIGYAIDYETGALEPETLPLFIPTIGVRGEF